MTGLGRRHAGRKERHPYIKAGFLISGEGQFWLGRETGYTEAGLAHYRDLVEADRLDFEKRMKPDSKNLWKR